MPCSAGSTPGRERTVPGGEKVGAAECDHVAFTEASVDWELWVAAVGKATSSRITITTKGGEGPLTVSSMRRSAGCAHARSEIEDLPESLIQLAEGEPWERANSLDQAPPVGHDDLRDVGD